MIVVIAIIGVLAALIMPIAKGVRIKQMRSRAQTELNQIDTAIQDYHAKLGFYPPDSPGSTNSQLYFELAGTVLTNQNQLYVTLDGSAHMAVADFGTVFGPNVTGFVNSSTSASGTDDRPAPVDFLKAGLKPSQVYVTNVTGSSVFKELVCSVQNTTELNPWQYVSTNPTNNPNTYDLWVDIVIAGKTNRISNWSAKPQVF